MDCFVCKSPFGIASHNDCAEAMTVGITTLRASRLRLAKFIRAGDATTLADEDAIRDEADRIVREEG